MFKNTAIFMRAKLTSSRLPRKHLLKIKGKPVIEHLIERVKDHTTIGRIVMCTTDDREDNRIVAIAKKHDLLCHRWRRGAVLQQYADAAKKFNIRTVVNVDCDDLLIDYDLLDKTAVIMEDLYNVDYLKWEGYPLGCTPLGMSSYGLELLSSKYSEGIEHLHICFEEEPSLEKLNIKVVNKLLAKPYIKDIRLTLDYMDDFKLFKIIYDNIYDGIYAGDKYIPFTKLMLFLDENQHLLEINNYLNNAYREHQLKSLRKKSE